MLAGLPAANSQTSPVDNGTVLSREAYKNTLTYQDWFQTAFGHGRRNPLDPPVDLARARAYYSPSLYRSLDGKADVWP
jgi:hypothetical protein